MCRTRLKRSSPITRQMALCRVNLLYTCIYGYFLYKDKLTRITRVWQFLCFFSSLNVYSTVDLITCTQSLNSKLAVLHRPLLVGDEAVRGHGRADPLQRVHEVLEGDASN